MNSSPWHVLHVHSNYEKRVAQSLAVRSVEHFLPLYTERVKWTDRTVVAERALFPGYVFARLTTQNRSCVIITPGVCRLLGDDERDMVSCEELDKIQSGLASGLLLRPHPCVTVGTRVRVRDGVFGGIEGMVTEFRHQCKVVIALAAVRQCFSLEVDMRDLVVLNKPAAKPCMKPIAAYGVGSFQTGHGYGEATA
jgi:transcriptional antiterminator NusG